jgi:hypothetical protein
MPDPPLYGQKAHKRDKSDILYKGGFFLVLFYTCSLSHGSNNEKPERRVVWDFWLTHYSRQGGSHKDKNIIKCMAIKSL